MTEASIMCNCEGCLLRSLFFENLGEEELGKLCSYKTETEYKKGELIIRENSEISEFMYLKEGLIKIFKSSENGDAQIIMLARPRDFISILTVFSDTHYHYSIAALEDSTICAIDLDKIKDIILSNGLFALGLLRRISEATDSILNFRFELSKKQLRGRIAHVLLHFADYVFKNESFDLPVSRKEFAEYIGMTTENVIRTLSEFRKDKLISINGKTIEILHRDMLKKISSAG
jgi:CRP-like cAMP-binding protein